MTSSNENDAAVTQDLERHKNEGTPRDQVERAEKAREGEETVQEPGRTRKAKVPVRKPPLGTPGAIATSTRQAPIDAFTFLVRQHDELRGLFAEFARTGTGCVRTRRLLLDEVAEKLENHLRLKERLVVPLHRRVNDDGALQCVEEMALMRALLRRIVRIEVSDKSLGAKVKLLEQLVLHHIDAEEKSHIPRLLERQPHENFGFLGVKMEEESRRLRGLHERRLRLREHRRWLASREKNSRRFFGGYTGGRDEFLGFGF